MTPEYLPTEHYDALLAEKVSRITDQFSSLDTPSVEIFTSPKTHYRMRAEFRIWHEGDALYHVIFNQQTRQRINVKQFPAASKLINRVMALIIPAIQHQPVLRQKLFQIDYLSTLSNQIVVTMLYHRPLDDIWRDAALCLRQTLRAQGLQLDIIGRASKTRIVLNQDYVDEILEINHQTLTYRQPENSFTQPNARVNCHMLAWAQEATHTMKGDLLELYCGNGNFSLALAKNFRQVLATEIAAMSVAAARHNCKVNRVDNMEIFRMSTQELVQAIRGERQFFRLREVDLASYQFNTLLVDPPRSGLDETTRRMVKNYANLVYISCNPDTLHRDLMTLKATHAIKRFALFDQFPYTHHIECGVLLAAR